MSFISFDMAPFHAGTVNIPTARRVMRPQGLEIYSRQALPTDAIGTFVLTLTNIAAGSRVQVESAIGTLYSALASGTITVSLQAYAPGSSNNAIVIKVRKGTESPYYQPYRTEATAIVGAQSIYVSQIPDE